MKDCKFPTLEEALYLHAELIKQFVGAEGVVDLGLLESVLARPRSGYYKTLSEQAAALLHSLTKDDCFVDGNKRMALALSAVFLMMNGFRLKSSADESGESILNVTTGQTSSVVEFAKWLETHMVKIRS